MTTRAHGTPARYKRGPDQNDKPGTGCRCTPCRAANAEQRRHRTRMLAYGWWEPLVDAAGTHRRLQALAYNGWSLGRLSARLAPSRTAFAILRSNQLTPAVAARVATLYDKLWDQPPPLATRQDRQAAAQVRNRARALGWVAPLAWDDDTIDNPDAKPAKDWERRSDTRRWGTLAEEAGELISFGLGMDSAAERLGVSRNTLTTTLARARKREEAADAA